MVNRPIRNFSVSFLPTMFKVNLANSDPFNMANLAIQLEYFIVWMRNNGSVMIV